MTGTDYCKLHDHSPDKAYDALFSEYCDYVHAIIFNRLRSVASREDIEECVSDVFADVFFGYDAEHSSENDMKGFIGTVAKRRAISVFRSITARQNHLSGDADDEMANMSSDTDIETESDKTETQQLLMSKIKELGEPDSTIILQKYYYDRSSGEIAELLSMKAATVRMRAARALDKLRALLTGSGITL